EGTFHAVFLGDVLEQPSTAKARFLSIERSTLPSAVSDVGFCQLRWPPRDGPLLGYQVLSIRPCSPREGEPRSIFGYDQLQKTAVPGSEERVNCNANARLIRGIVKDLHIPARDSLAPLPCFTIELLDGSDVVGGMSGGPVINEAGFVCGIVSLSRSWECTATC